MSADADEPLTDEDRALLEHLEEQTDEERSLEDVEEHVRELRREVRQQRREFRQFRQSVEQRLERLEDGQQQPDEEDTFPLYTYAQLDEEDREAELTTSEYIAVTIHEQWADIAWTLGGAQNYAGESSEQRAGVDTKTTANAKYNPSRLKHRLKKELGWDPAANQIYRALKKLAELSGGEEVVDATSGRVHVRGGLYEYREMATTDAQDTKRVLWRADQ